MILRKNGGFCLGCVPICEPQNVFLFPRAQRVDGLCIIADHGKAFTVWFQRMDDLALQGAGFLVFIDEHMVEIVRKAFCERGGLHHHVPIEQQIIDIQHVVLLFSGHIFAIKARQIRFTLARPRKQVRERLFEREPGIDPVAIDPEAGFLARKEFLLAGEAEVVVDHAHEFSCVCTAEHRETGIQSELIGEQTQDSIAHGIIGAGPQQARLHAAIAHLSAVGHDLRDNGLRVANHFLGRTLRERQRQDPSRIDAVQDQMGGAMRQRTGFTRAGAGQDQHGTRRDALILRSRSICGGSPLGRVESIERRRWFGLQHLKTIQPNFMDIELLRRRTPGCGTVGLSFTCYATGRTGQMGQAYPGYSVRLTRVDFAC